MSAIGLLPTRLHSLSTRACLTCAATCGGTGLSSTWGVIPREVLLASTSPVTRPETRSSQEQLVAELPRAAASWSARSRERLAITTRAPLEGRRAAPKASARPAPPAPMTTTVLSFSGDSLSAADGAAAAAAAAPPATPATPRSIAEMAASQSVL
ncbi:hypothetical protein Vafri_8305 [Volvox africanus]|nr:hypothetical protein Vafri_8305 [Volvox africanus]